MKTDRGIAEKPNLKRGNYKSQGDSRLEHGIVAHFYV